MREHMGCLSTDRALLLAAKDTSLEPRHHGENFVCVLRVHPGEELGDETNEAKKSRARRVTTDHAVSVTTGALVFPKVLRNVPTLGSNLKTFDFYSIV